MVSFWDYVSTGATRQPLTVDQGIEDELAVLLHQVVDVSKDATVEKDEFISSRDASIDYLPALHCPQAASSTICWARRFILAAPNVRRGSFWRCRGMQQKLTT